MNTVAAHSKYCRSTYILLSMNIVKIKKSLNNILVYNNIFNNVKFTNHLLIYINHVELQIDSLTLSFKTYYWNSLRSSQKISKNQTNKGESCSACFISTVLKSLNTHHHLQWWRGEHEA